MKWWQIYSIWICTFVHLICMCLYNLFRHLLLVFSPKYVSMWLKSYIFIQIAQWFTKKDWVGTALSLITHSMVFIMKYLDSSPIWNQLLQVISVKHPLPLAWIQLHFCEISLTICSAISLDFFKLCSEVFNRGSVSMHPVFRRAGVTETEPLSGCQKDAQPSCNI